MLRGSGGTMVKSFTMAVISLMVKPGFNFSSPPTGAPMQLRIEELILRFPRAISF